MYTTEYCDIEGSRNNLEGGKKSSGLLQGLLEEVGPDSAEWERGWQLSNLFVGLFLAQLSNVARRRSGVKQTPPKKT